jgi:hypothetical protein
LANTRKQINIETNLCNKTIKSRITVSKKLKKYFKNFDFFIRYDKGITEDKGILNIPATSFILPIAWVTDSDVYVDELDKTFAESMDTLQKEYKKIYPKAPFKTMLNINKKTETHLNTNNIALLFSGGLDCTYSLYKNRSLNPLLIMIFGTMDTPLSKKELIEDIKTVYTDFTVREKLNLSFIHTNALELFDHDRLRHLWGKLQENHEGDFWMGLGYPLGYTSLTAPLSIDRFSHLFFATYLEKRDLTTESYDASSLKTDEKIRWAILQVRHDGFLPRYEKILELKPYLHKNKINLRVCWSDSKYIKQGNINCNKCEKCLRTISYLSLNGIDPNKCGFNIDESTFKTARLIIGKKLLTKKIIKHWWKPLQINIPEKIEGDYNGSKEFFEWLKTVKLDNYGREYRTPVMDFYFNTPYVISKKLKTLYEKIRPLKYYGHESDLIRESEKSIDRNEN